MADLSDITAYLANAASTAVYPNGTSSPSIAPASPGKSVPMDVAIYEGWPISELLDADVAGMQLVPGSSTPIPRANGQRAHVSVYPLQASKEPYQIQDNTYTIVPPAINLVVTTGGQPGAANCTVTITGTPAPGEFVTIEADRQSIFSETGGSAAAILASLLTDAQAIYPTSTLVGSTLTIPASYAFVVRQGGLGTAGKVTHRQCHRVMVTVWAPDHNTRTVLASAIDVAIKNNIIITLPDTTQARVVYDRTIVSDTMEEQTVYRRDLIYDVEYATLFTFPAYTITSVTTTLAAGEYNFPQPPPNVNFYN